MLAIETTNAKHSSTALVLINGGSEDAWSRLGDARRTVDTNCLPAGYQTHEFILRTYKGFPEWYNWLADGFSCAACCGLLEKIGYVFLWRMGTTVRPSRWE